MSRGAVGKQKSPSGEPDCIRQESARLEKHKTHIDGEMRLTDELQFE